MRRSPAGSTNRSLAAFGKLQHIHLYLSSPTADIARDATANSGG